MVDNIKPYTKNVRLENLKRFKKKIRTVVKTKSFASYCKPTIVYGVPAYIYLYICMYIQVAKKKKKKSLKKRRKGYCRHQSEKASWYKVKNNNTYIRHKPNHYKTHTLRTLVSLCASRSPFLLFPRPQQPAFFISFFFYLGIRKMLTKKKIPKLSYNKSMLSNPVSFPISHV